MEDWHFSDGFRQEPYGPHILKDGWQQNVEPEHGDTTELFYALGPRHEGLNEMKG
jgi:hypothetical protein